MKNVIISILSLIALIGCRKITANVILGCHYIPANSYHGVAGKKLLTLGQVDDYVGLSKSNDYYLIHELFTNRTPSTCYFYITTDAELIAIKNLQLHGVHAALINTNVAPGIRVYVIKGNPNAHIKPTSEWIQHSDSNSDDL